MGDTLIRWTGVCVLACTALWITGCDTSPQPTVLQGQTMGTTWLVRAHGLSNPVVLQGLVEQELEDINASMSTYRPDSEISLFNAAEAGCHAVSAAFHEVVAEALNIHAATGGLFDVTVGPLVDLWGFGPVRGEQRIPADSDIAKLKATTGSHHLRITEGQLCKARDEIRVDLSAIAKGYAVDQIADLLAEHGVTDYLVEVGGELRVLGYREGETPWQVAVERPDPAARSVYGVLGLSAGAVATSGDYRNFFEYEGHRYSHTLDPRTGWPVVHRLGSVTVVHSSAMRADALATALNVMGPKQGIEWANDRNIEVLFLVQKAGEDEAETDQENFEFESLASNEFSAKHGQIH